MTKTTKPPVAAAITGAAIAGALAGTADALNAAATGPAGVAVATSLAGPADAINAAFAEKSAEPLTIGDGLQVTSYQVGTPVADSLFEPSKLKIKLLTESAQMPQYATGGAACFDLHANDSVGVVPGHSVEVSTGLAFEVPVDHVMLVFSRSGHGFKSGVRLANSVGVIDSDYRGEVKVKLHNDSQSDFIVDQGARVAQAMVLPIARMPLLQVEELSNTERGNAGFGSTGQ